MLSGTPILASSLKDYDLSQVLSRSSHFPACVAEAGAAAVADSNKAHNLAPILSSSLAHRAH